MAGGRLPTLMSSKCRKGQRSRHHRYAKEPGRNTKVCMECGDIRLVVLHGPVSAYGEGIWKNQYAKSKPKQQ